MNPRIEQIDYVELLKDKTHQEIIEIGRGIVFMHISNMLTNNRNAGYFWIALPSAYGQRMKIMSEMFDEENKLAMYQYFSSKACVCKVWDGLWNEDKGWSWHKNNTPDGSCKRKYIRLNNDPRKRPTQRGVTPHGLWIKYASIKTGELLVEQIE